MHFGSLSYTSKLVPSASRVNVNGIEWGRFTNGEKMKFLVLALIAFVCGSLGARLAGAGRMGCIGSIVLGFLGAMIGGWISRSAGVPDLFYPAGIPLFWSILGAAIVIAVLHFLTGSRSRK